MNDWARSIKRTGAATAEQAANANVHAYVGIIILLLTCIRLALRSIQGVRAAPTNAPAIVRLAGHSAHVVLYGLLIALPVTGMAAYYLGHDGVGDIHAEVLKTALWTFLAAHIFRALAHHFYWKTSVLRRMTIG